MNSRSSFTLIELLVVIAILAILSVAVVLVINPADIIKQSRDSQRLTDLNNLNKALAVFDVTNPDDFTGTSTVVYTSLPDSTTTCANLSLPALPAGYTYQCVTSSTLAKADGTGWIPVNFQNISYGSPLNKLPIDPTNSSTTGQYYTYIMGGSWALSARVESDKYRTKAVQDNGYDFDRIEVGSNLVLNQAPSGLIAAYFQQAGSGTTAQDYSNSGNNGTITAGSGGWTTDQNGGNNLAYDFDGVTSTIIISPNDNLRPLTHDFSVSFWLKTSDSDGAIISDRQIGGGVANGFSVYISGSKLRGFMEMIGSNYRIKTTNTAINDNTWHMGTMTWAFSGNLITLYIDGAVAPTADLSGGTVTNIQSTSSIAIGKYNDGTAPLDSLLADFRVYNRVLSAVEVQAIYNSTR